MPEKEGSEDKKKSVKKEELDLTKIAEAFGGYIIEKTSPEELAAEMKKKREEKFGNNKSEKVGTSTPSERTQETEHSTSRRSD